MGPPPEAVGSTVAKGETWETTLSAVGSVSSLRSVTVSNEVPGVVSQIRFESGAIAREGQVLVELDASVERAQLASAEARARSRALERRARSQVLVAGQRHLAARSSTTTRRSSRPRRADVAALEAQIERKVVRAPFTGRLGIRAVNLGQYLTPGHDDHRARRDRRRRSSTSRCRRRTWRSVSVGHAGARDVRGRGGERPTGRSSPSIRPSTRPRATSSSARASPNRTASCARACSSTSRSSCPKQRAVVAVPAHRDRARAVRRLGLRGRATRSRARPGMRQTPDGKPVKIARQQFVRARRRRAATSSRSPRASKAGQEVVSAGAFKLRNGAPVVVDNTRQARRRSSTRTPRTAEP